MISDILAWASILLWAAVPVVIFIARHWLLALISKGVQHKFDQSIEGLRAELRKSEELLKSELRNRENEISTLRNSVLAGTASRQALLDRRQFKSVERVWTAVNDMAPFKGQAGMMAVLKFKEIAKEADDPKIQQFLRAIESGAPDQIKSVARDERPFLPELAWAYFSAYRSVIMGSVLRLQILKTGLKDSDRFMSNEGIRKILKAALPHQSKFIDEHEPEVYYYLLDELEQRLLDELRKILRGEGVDQAAAARAKGILDAIAQAETANAEAAGKAKARAS